MASVADDTVNGFNRFMDDQRKVPGTATVTMHQFDDRFETPIKGRDIHKAPNLTAETFVPRGNTALLDAIGRAIGETGERLEKAPEHERAEKVIFVIVTDGHENASRKFTESEINKMIEHQKTKYSWEFVFLGANQDAIASAQGIGISVANAMTYASNKIGTEKLYAAFSSNVRSFRCSTSKDMAWSDEQREDQKKAGA